MCSLQRDLNKFFASLEDEDYSIMQVTKSAFSQARQNFKPSAFVELTHDSVIDFYNNQPYTVWHDHRLLAVDGSKINLPTHIATKKIYGETGYGPNSDSMRTQALTSIMFDPINLITLDGRLADIHSSEQEMLQQHLNEKELFLSNDLMIFDRFYPSKRLMIQLQDKDLHFCMRMKDNWWIEVNKMIENGEKDKRVVFQLPKKDRDLLETTTKKLENIECRIVVITLSNGFQEVLCTSLLDENVYKYEDFEELYHFRWGIEEAYKEFKCVMELENFSGKTPKAIEQDFFAKIFMMTICSIVSHPINNKVRKEYKIKKIKGKVKYERKINRKNLISFMREVWEDVFIKKIIDKPLKALEKILSRTTEPIIFGRSNERKKYPKKPPAQAYKRI